MLSQCSYLLYFGDIPNLVSCAFSTIPIFPPFNSQNFLFTCIYTCICTFFVLENKWKHVLLECLYMGFIFDAYILTMKRLSKHILGLQLHCQIELHCVHMIAILTQNAFLSVIHCVLSTTHTCTLHNLCYMCC